MKWLRIGLFIKNKKTLSRGFVLDWGMRNPKLRDYVPVPAYTKEADAVRVRTENSIEVWPVNSIEFRP